jgi:hypothetical protein
MYETISRWRCTLTTPASGSGWATAKPWESFLAGVICFAHPAYDTQGHIIPTREQLRDYPDGDRKTLFQWLRPPTPVSLQQAVHVVSNDYDTWRFLAEEQRRYVDEAYAEMRVIEEIEERCSM